ncbi:dTDP-4-dehydrorhamnose reductase [Methylomarinovum caldicuralii]|uniref:dTDP-4-dehydrorhamnose reductase n=1 Tax=Methylomarinovum caldicuralii TaxID=438856 RepID=A0AAU9CE98_9GAMM|nr:dTDP-4-dehydrorhamnose reductase [Methylomarinovum caldicuralii]BCX81320.1 dTDP-4-dehydrorhamnose reductase [Methylomarinovum caldicuralii]
MTRPILVIGRRGQVAFELRRALLPLGQVIALDRRSEPAVDLADPDSIVAALRQIRPAVIVNAAAYTAVDRAEAEPQLAEKINATAPGILAEETRRLGTGLIHYSTDYVFAGDGDRPYREDDPTGPQSVYGRTKLAGEEAIRASGCDHWILRTAWVYGARGKNFLLTMLRLLREKERIGVVADQSGTPTWSRVIAETTAQMLARRAVSDTCGTYHLTCTGATTWHGFADAIRRRGIDAGLLPETAARIDPITTADYPTPARRPAWSVLDTGKLTATFGLTPPAWDTALALCLEELAGQSSPPQTRL